MSLVQASQQIQQAIDSVNEKLKQGNLTADQRKEYGDLLAQLYSSRGNLATYGSTNSDEVAGAVNEASNALQFMNDAKGLLNDMYINDEKTINYLKTTQATKLKQTQFNNYFSQKYNYNVAIMKILVLTSVLLMICILLYTRNLLPKFLYISLVVTIIVISVITIVFMLISELRRSNTDFNKFWWFFNPNTATVN